MQDDPSDRPPGTLYRYASGPEEYLFEYSAMVSSRNKDGAINSSQTHQPDETSLNYSDQQQQLTDAITSSVNTILSHESHNKVLIPMRLFYLYEIYKTQLYTVMLYYHKYVHSSFSKGWYFTINQNTFSDYKYVYMVLMLGC